MIVSLVMASLILLSLMLLLSCSFTFPFCANTHDADNHQLVDQKRRYPAHSDVDTNGKFLRVILLKVSDILYL